MIVITDTPIGNISSVKNAFIRIGANVVVSSEPDIIEQANALVLPGVGAFGQGVKYLRKSGLANIIHRRVIEDKMPILGICLGYQLLANVSEEMGEHEGLGLIPGRVEKLQPKVNSSRVPNIGWHKTTPKKTGVLYDLVKPRQSYYFVHSYYFICEEQSDVAAEIDYGGEKIVVAVERENIFGVQFHPEKSQDPGLNLLKSFSDFVNRNTKLKT